MFNLFDIAEGLPAGSAGEAEPMLELHWTMASAKRHRSIDARMLAKR
jgi:hypothetical protein